MDGKFETEHHKLLAAFDRLVPALDDLHAHFQPLGDTSYDQHYQFASRARDLGQYLRSAVALARSSLYPAALIISRTAIEFQLIDSLLFLADRYRIKIPKFPEDEFEKLLESYNNGAEDILELSHSAQGTLTIVRSGMYTRGEKRGPDAQRLSVYWRYMEEYDPFVVPLRAQPFVRNLFDPENERAAARVRNNSSVWWHALRWDAIIDNLRLNGLYTQAHTAAFDVHYSFLSSLVHPVSKEPFDSVGQRVQDGRHFVAYDHYASELVLLYAIALATREISAFVSMTNQPPAVALDNRAQLEELIELGISATSHLWWPPDPPPLFDREEDAVIRVGQDRGKHPRPVPEEALNAIPDEEVLYYSDPLERLRQMHLAGRGYPWIHFRSPWPRADARRLL